MWHRERVAAALLLCGLGACKVAAQQPDEPPPTATLTVTAQLVLVDASVTWRKTGAPVPGLGARDFTVQEDGVPVEISTCSTDILPLSLVVLFDLTDTVHPVLQHLAAGAADAFSHLRPQDEVAVMSFSSHAKLEQRFTRDRMQAMEGIDAASASYDHSEPTFLFEDLWEAVQQSEASRLPNARRVEVWVTDGSANDQETQRRLAQHAPPVLHSEAEATATLMRSGVVVNVLLERSALHGDGRYGDLARLAGLTGGLTLSATEGDAARRLNLLLDQLRARYTLGYKAISRPKKAVAEGSPRHDGQTQGRAEPRVLGGAPRSKGERS